MTTELPEFNHGEFMAQEFPLDMEGLPDADRLVRHLDQITSLLFDCAAQSLKKGTNDDNISILHTNTRYTLAVNYRLRTLNLIKVLEELQDIDGNGFFDEGTANILTRSLLESYLVYFRLYNANVDDEEKQKLYFSLYDLSSILHFTKHVKAIYGFAKQQYQGPDLSSQVDTLLLDIARNPEFKSLNLKTQNAIEKIGKGKLDYLSFINFTALIKESPLPTEFTSNFYSYSSSFAHSEGFSSRFSQMLFDSKDDWKKKNEQLKFKLLSLCLIISSQFFVSYFEYDGTELEDDKAREVWEVVSLTSYYLQAARLQN